MRPCPQAEPILKWFSERVESNTRQMLILHITHSHHNDHTANEGHEGDMLAKQLMASSFRRVDRRA